MYLQVRTHQYDLQLAWPFCSSSAHDAVWRTSDEALKGQIAFILEHGSFDSATLLADAVAHWVLIRAGRTQMHQSNDPVKIHLRDEFADEAVRVERDTPATPLLTDHQSFGQVDIVYETHSCGLYLERLRPHSVLPTHQHLLMDEYELVLDEGLLLQGEPAQAGVARHWPRGHPHMYENATSAERSFMCIDTPAFVPSDEIELIIDTHELRRTRAMTYFHF